MLSQDPDFQYVSTNPCGEIPMASGNSCLLGSINLDKFVVNQFTDKAYFDYEKLAEITTIAVRALNVVLDEGLPKHPLREQREAVRDWRQIGLGTTSLATALIRLGLTYGSKESMETVYCIYKTIAKHAIRASLDLAKKDGMYPKCKPELIVQSEFFKQLEFTQSEIDNVLKYGLRNCQILTCAPNGSIGSMIGTGSTGIESLFALSYYRTTKTLENKDKTFKIDVPIVSEYKQITGNKDIPKYFVSVYNIDPIDRIKVQATAQRWIDGAISSTCNIPESATIEDVKNIYIAAWKFGCKGCTIFRDNCNRVAILNNEPKKENSSITTLNQIQPVSREEFGDVLTGSTFKKKTACGTLYITINKDEHGNIVEIFTNSSKNGTCKANLNGETRMASLALRAGVKVDEVIDQLKGIHCQSCAFAKAKGNNIDGTSCPDIMAKCIKEACTNKLIKENTGEKCPECGQPVRHEGGCIVCSCGFSRCG